jgi:polysaccharide export outer membrane protein
MTWNTRITLPLLLGFIVLTASCAPKSEDAIKTGDGNSLGSGGGISASSEEDIIRPGDGLVIRITITDVPQSNVEDRVDDYGNVTLPMIGDVLAEGKTTARLEEEIRGLYVEKGIYKSPQITVILTKDRFFYVEGEVRAGGGQLVFTSGITLMRAIAMAGGWGEWADRRNVTITRGDQRITVDCTVIEQDPSQDVEIRPGDKIKVPRRRFS